MSSGRSRYYWWLFRAYFKRMKRTILSSLVLGILVFFALVGLINFYFLPALFKTTENVGYAGSYTAQTIPESIISEVSYGLTKVEQNGKVSPAAAESFTISNDKVYTFRIKKGQRFHNGEELTAENIDLRFEGVSKKIIDRYTIQFVLKNPYSPFLVSASRPIFAKDFSGLGRYKVKNIDINAGFLRTITLQDTINKKTKKKIYFYPTQKALKVAFMLGEVDKAYNLNSTSINTTDISKWNGVKTTEYTDYSSLLTIFYNNADEVLNNKKIRQALNYALSEKIAFGKRAFGPIPPNSIYFELSSSYKTSDGQLSKTLLSTVKEPIGTLVISTPEEYAEAAKQIQKNWQKIGVNAAIKITDGVPSNFQILLYKIKLPLDPDQYILWHSAQVGNIVHYKNLRIDKLLEDGRSITDIKKREKLYADFQKYLSDDAPASFYYFPTNYTLSKK